MYWGFVAPLHRQNAAQIDAAIDTNLRGAPHPMRALLPRMVARHRGHLINIGSTACAAVLAGTGPYTAAKVGLTIAGRAARFAVAAAELVHPWHRLRDRRDWVNIARTALHHREVAASVTKVWPAAGLGVMEEHMLEAPESLLVVDRRNLPFRLDEGIAHRAAIGLLVLATDNTIEHEWRGLIGGLNGIAFYESRLMNSPSITPETLREMERSVTGATALLRPGERIDVVAFGCTSGSLVIGEETIFTRVREARPGVPCTTPLTAGIAALRALGAGRVALITPYVDRINRDMRRFFEQRDIQVPVMGSFNHEDDNEVARIDAASLELAILELGRHEAVDAVFVSCTSLRVAELIERLEAALGKPVTSSNHAMAWHSLRLAGIRDKLLGRGRLFTV